MDKLTPLNGNVIIKPIEFEEQTYGNIVIPDLGKEKPGAESNPPPLKLVAL